jgi:cell division protein FtsI/penicillin-binding protein 2
MYTLDEIVSESANAGIVEVALRMRREELYQTFDVFGFGRRTGVGFPGESAGILPTVDSWSGLSQASLALGQELTVTPLQVALAYAAIANGGWLLQPRLVARATGGEDSVPDREQWRAHVLDAGLSERLGRMLEAVVEDGTGKQAQVPGYRVAGKTGTAQRAVRAASTTSTTWRGSPASCRSRTPAWWWWWRSREPAGEFWERPWPLRCLRGGAGRDVPLAVAPNRGDGAGCRGGDEAGRPPRARSEAACWRATVRSR